MFNIIAISFMSDFLYDIIYFKREQKDGSVVPFVAYVEKTPTQ